MSLLESLEAGIRKIAKEAVDEKIASWRVAEKPEERTEKQFRPWNRENAKWEKGEEEVLVQRVSIFLDHCALAHRRTRGAIIARLNRLLQGQRLCGLRDDSQGGRRLATRARRK